MADVKYLLNLGCHLCVRRLLGVSQGEGIIVGPHNECVNEIPVFIYHFRNQLFALDGLNLHHQDTAVLKILNAFAFPP